MSFLPIEKVCSEHLVDPKIVAAIPAGSRFADPATINAQINAPVEAITWHMVGKRIVAEVRTANGIKMFDAKTAQALPSVGADEASAIAKSAWKSAIKPESNASRVTIESVEYRGALPAWRIVFADPDSTSLFVAADTGSITPVRTGTWRLHDFF